MSMFTFAISYLTTSNLPWFMDLTFQVSMQYCSLQHQTTSITCHIHNLVLFLLWLHLFILCGVTSPLFSSSILGTYQPGEFLFQCLIFLPFHTVHGARILKWFPFPPPMDQILSELSMMTYLSVLYGPTYGMAHSFIELDKAVVHEISLISFLWLWISFCLPSDEEG